MKSFKKISLKHSRTQSLPFSNLNHSVAVRSSPEEDIQNHTATHPSRQPIHHANEIALLVSNSTNPKQLCQVFGHVIRSHFIELHPASFHYNNISRTYGRFEKYAESVHVYVMMCRAGLTPDQFSLPIVLKAASQSLDFDLARQVHGIAVKFGLETDMYCESGLISVYCKAGEFGDARNLFVNNSDRKLGSWNAIVGGLSQGGRAKDAIQMFVEMTKSGFMPDDVTMVSVTSACGNLGDLNLAQQLHKFVFQIKDLVKTDLLMMNSLVDMYGKCGRMDLARVVFGEMEEKNVSSWTSLIVGYSTHGHVSDALECFQRMTEAGIRPNHVTFVGVLSACVHGGLVQQGKHYFDIMMKIYGIRPSLPHYGCMVDLLGRAGLLGEARSMVEQMPMKANVVIWGSLMGACEKHGDVQMGEWVSTHLVELESDNDGVFVALSNIYASHCMWEEVERMREIMKQRKLAKIPAYSLPDGS
ncbi:pentatricopeptide repeat-containing protein-like [Dorcoceras hygrometricum]|uniref:Pentatricopeptide repeat-containing protein-like n=1 Tax=Dorcoceras hygrometricum TaxID=472368 RepID=A0A2Z7AUM8_9LAMI|nr:pentatricopeptide repeat-containing protein-like [Dorcoceras hygrometricum]